MAIAIVAVADVLQERKNGRLYSGQRTLPRPSLQTATNAVYPQGCRLPHSSISFPFCSRLGHKISRFAAPASHLHLHPRHSSLASCLLHLELFGIHPVCFATSVFHLNSELSIVLVSSSPGPDPCGLCDSNPPLTLFLVSDMFHAARVSPLCPGGFNQVSFA